MVTCQSSELGWEVTVELPADFLSLGRGSVTYVSRYPEFWSPFCFYDGETKTRADVATLPLVDFYSC